MNASALHQFGATLLESHSIDSSKKDKIFAKRFFDHLDDIEYLFNLIYGEHPKRNEAFDTLLNGIIKQHKDRSTTF